MIPDGEPIGSVPLAVGVLLSVGVEEDVTKMAHTTRAENFQRSAYISAGANMTASLAAMVALVKHWPSTRGPELGRR